jgi:DNA sulfur modification protein DndD
MILFDSLILENFGCYKGRQTLDLDGHKGVLVFHAENGVGKTQLLYAFQWVFTGKIGNPKKALRPEDQLNRITKNEAEKAGSEATMKVSIKASVDGVPIEVTRKLTKKADGNFEHTLSLKEGGNVLGAAASPNRLDEILSSDIQQFFFFDGEFIREFEEALSTNSSNVATPLVNIIENALGIPTLEKVSDLLGKIERSTLQEVTQGNKASKHNKDIVREINILKGKEAADQKSLKGATETFNNAAQKLTKLEDLLKGNDDAKKIISARNKEEGRLEALRDIKNQTLEKLQLSASASWKALLHESLSARSEEIANKVTRLNEALANIRRRNLLSVIRQEASQSGECPCCGADYKDDGETSHQHSDESTLENELTVSSNILKSLTDIDTKGAKKDLLVAIKANIDARNKVSTSTTKLENFKKDLANTDEESIQEILDGHANQSVVKNTANGLIGELKEDLLEVRSSIRILNGKFKDEDDEKTKKLLEKSKLSQRLSAFFAESSIRYRSDQQKKVESAATKLFLSIAHQKDYASLSIGKNYGLDIIHKDGSPVKVPSSGYKHIVSLSLIGALQQTALIRGPVVMDSPFGRLDGEHGSALLRAMPKMAPQVVLLVHSKELTPEFVTESLDGFDIIAQIQGVEHSADESTMKIIGERK